MVGRQRMKESSVTKMMDNMAVFFLILHLRGFITTTYLNIDHQNWKSVLNSKVLARFKYILVEIPRLANLEKSNFLLFYVVQC